MATQMQLTRIAITDGFFKQSYQDGVSWGLYGDMPALSDTIIVEYVRDNILGEAFEPLLSPETVTRNIAFLVGWLLTAQRGIHYATTE
jgi:hypothetical protein